MRQLTEFKRTGSSSTRCWRPRPVPPGSDMRWIELTAARLDQLAAEVRK